MDSVLENIRRRPEVRFAEPNYTRRVLLAAPNDPAYNNLDSSIAVWDPSDATWYQWGMHVIDALGAWNIYPSTYYTAATKPANPPKVAVIDTGIDYGGTDSIAHPDFINLGGSSPDAALGGQIDIANGTNVLGGYSPTDFADDYGHGTAVAGVIGASTNNGGTAPSSGIAGLAYHCQILPIKCFDNTGYGTESDLAESIIWAVDHGAVIINISAGDIYYSQLEQDAVNYAWEHGALVVAAAGNEGDSMNRPTYPAACAGVMGVASTSWPYDAPASYSNYGDYVDVAAPGGDVDMDTLAFWLTWTTMPTELVPMHYAGLPEGNARYQYQTGTSLACPFVSGLASLYAASQGITQSTPGGLIRIFRAIQRGCDDVGLVPGWHPYWGWGRINAAQTLLENDNRASAVGAITGQVTYYGTAVQNAVVKATPVAGGYAPGATTRSDGMYRIANIDPGLYDISATYFSQTKTIEDVEVLTSCDTPRVIVNIDNPRVISSTPSSAPNSGSVAITDLEGMGFQSGATVKLEKSGETDVIATGVSVVNFTQITCTLDLNGVTPGTWDITVTNPDGQWGTLTDGFTVESDDSTPPEVVEWTVVATHGGGVGEIATTCTDGYVETRTGRVSRLAVVFTDPLAPVTPADLMVVASKAGDISARVSATTLSTDAHTLFIDFSPALPDDDTFEITLSETITGRDNGLALTGDRDRILKCCVGDVNHSSRVTITDMYLMQSMLNKAVTAANCHYDLNQNGLITITEMYLVQANMNHSAPDITASSALVSNAPPSFVVSPGWSRIAIPGDVGSAALDTIASGLGTRGADWELFTVDAGGALAVSSSGTETGRGYWLYSRRGGSLQCPPRSASSPPDEVVHLEKGWNIIGCPFAHAVEWSDRNIQVLHSGEWLPLSGGVERNWIYAVAYGYEDGGNTRLAANSGAMLEPWQGYFVCARVPCELLISAESSHVESGVAGAGSVEQEAADWQVRLVASAGDYADRCTVIGAAARGLGASEPHPPFGPGVDLVVKSQSLSDPGTPGEALSLQASGASGYKWRIAVHSGSAGLPVTVSWPDLTQVPVTLTPYLVDTVTGKRVYMRTRTGYTYTPSTAGVRELGLEFVPRIVGGGQVTSLSAVPRGAGGAEIAFTLGEQAAVDVDILNIAGRVIRRLSSDAVLPAGVNRVVWDGVSTAGTRVPSGTYFVKLTVRSEDGRQASRTCALSVHR